MSKFWIVVIAIFGTVFVADKVLGSVADFRQSGVREQVTDLKQVGLAIQTDGSFDANAMNPSTEMGKAMKETLSKIQARVKRLEREVQACYIPNPLDWEMVSTPEGRKKSLAWLKAERSAYESFDRDSKTLQQELLKITGGSQKPNHATLATRRVNELRSGVYGSYRNYILAVDKSKLIRKDGEVYFLEEADRLECESLSKKCGEAEEKFTRFSEEAEKLRARDLARIKDRASSYSF